MRCKNGTSAMNCEQFRQDLLHWLLQLTIELMLLLLLTGRGGACGKGLALLSLMEGEFMSNSISNAVFKSPWTEYKTSLMTETSTLGNASFKVSMSVLWNGFSIDIDGYTERKEREREGRKKDNCSYCGNGLYNLFIACFKSVTLISPHGLFIHSEYQHKIQSKR